MTAEAASREWPGVTTAAGAGERRRVARGGRGDDAGTAMARGHAGIDQTVGGCDTTLGLGKIVRVIVVEMIGIEDDSARKGNLASFLWNSSLYAYHLMP